MTERTYRRWPDEVGSGEVGPEGAGPEAAGPEGAGPGGIGGQEPAVDVPGLVMRVRRTCDLSQRDLGTALGLDQSQIARIESARRRIDLLLLARILALADLRIAVLDRDGVEVVPVPGDVLRDNAGRRMPAHLDVRAGSDRPVSAMLNAHSDRPTPQAWYHHRPERDRRRRVTRDTGAMHDQPTRRGLAQFERDRRDARARDVRQRAAALLDLDCSCSSACWERGACADACTCRCEQ